MQFPPPWCRSAGGEPPRTVPAPRQGRRWESYGRGKGRGNPRAYGGGGGGVWERDAQGRPGPAGHRMWGGRGGGGCGQGGTAKSAFFAVFLCFSILAMFVLFAGFFL